MSIASLFQRPSGFPPEIFLLDLLRLQHLSVASGLSNLKGQCRLRGGRFFDVVDGVGSRERAEVAVFG